MNRQRNVYDIGKFDVFVVNKWFVAHYSQNNYNIEPFE